MNGSGGEDLPGAAAGQTGVVPARPTVKCWWLAATSNLSLFIFQLPVCEYVGCCC